MVPDALSAGESPAGKEPDKMSKRILILNGSPRLNGNTAALIREFTRGAEAGGNTVSRFDLDRMAIHGCRGCLGGGKNPDSPCVQKDDMEKIYPVYRSADIVVFASPMYYWAFSGQLKCVLDRLFAVTEYDPNWVTPHKKAVLLMAAEGTGAENEAPVLHYYQSLLGFLGWENLGSLIAGGVLKVGAIAGHPLLRSAFELGQSIH